MSVNIRPARVDDVTGMQACNLQNLPENNLLHYYLHHLLTWPSLPYVAEDAKGRIVGYVIARIVADNAGAVHGHLRSISVLRPYRRTGLARKLALQCRKPSPLPYSPTSDIVRSEEAMRTTYRAAYVVLNVRKTNRGAICLYRDALGFAVHAIREKHYADGEDAYVMRLSLDL
ncbi:acyl-CoA N-acyltransferase [Artomyces pyxidatus]|uniref:Acyl-CoA N-acyltransferase n=1 Tax=Artomyces pyxidatus TaxID=48021 RepID=A0ACB8TCZ8_9AGAM|nr:acyl-CoA N-acyltransferase [Artomyces pyxidatus]